jgi:hypothetical protein
MLLFSALIALRSLFPIGQSCGAPGRVLSLKAVLERNGWGGGAIALQVMRTIRKTGSAFPDHLAE